MIAPPVDLDLVTGRVHGLDRFLGVDLDPDRDVLERLWRKAFRVQGIDIVHQAAVQGQHLGVFDLDPFLRLGQDGENASPEGIPAHVLEQCRVPLPPDNVLIDAARLFGWQDLAREPLAIDPHAKVIDRRPLGQRKSVRALQLVAAFVDKDLVDVRGGDLVLDGHGHAMILDRQVGGYLRHRWVDDDDPVSKCRLDGGDQQAQGDPNDRQYRSFLHLASSHSPL